jgi:hypothetical protein
MEGRYRQGIKITSSATAVFLFFSYIYSPVEKLGRVEYRKTEDGKNGKTD